MRAYASLVSTPSVVVLDVRTPAEFATGHLPDAVSPDLTAGEFAARGAWRAGSPPGPRPGRAIVTS